jgi:hypothetical protein
MPNQIIELGDQVKDKVTGFTGIAVGEIRWIYGCKRYVVQPKATKDGKLEEGHNFDEPSLEIIKKHAIKLNPEEPETGGPVTIPIRPNTTR